MSEVSNPQSRIFCRVCNSIVDAHTNAYNGSDGSPNDGDASVCFYCGTLSVFRAGVPTEPTDDERAQLLTDPAVINVIAFIKLEHNA